MNENYEKAKTLATVEHFGETFRIVRRRSRGKPTQGLVLVHGATFMASVNDKQTDPDIVATGLAGLLEKNFPTRELLMQSLASVLEKYKPLA